MVCMKKELAVSLTDIESVVLECGKCHGQISIPMKADKISAQHPNPYEQCMVCGKYFSPSPRECIEAFRKAVSDIRGDTTISLKVNPDALEKT